MLRPSKWFLPKKKKNLSQKNKGTQKEKIWDIFKSHYVLKGKPSKDTNWPENIQNVQMFSFILCRLHPVNIYAYLFFFFALNLSSSWCSHVGLLFTNKEQEKVGSWCNIQSCHTCQSCSWWLQNTNCQTQNGHFWPSFPQCSNISFKQTRP